MRHESTTPETLPDGRGLRIGIIVSRFNQAVTGRLLAGAEGALAAAGVLPHGIERFWVPGAFELPFAAKLLGATNRFDALICLGCVIRGETPHFDYISSAVAQGLTAAALDTGVHVAFGVLTTDNEAQAVARSQSDRSNKGYEAAAAALEMARLRQHVFGRPRTATGS